MRRPVHLVIGILFCTASAATYAHHSFIGFYDQSQIIEIEGVLREADWRNPHGRLTVDVTNSDGSVSEWEIETGSVSVLRIRGLDRQFVQPGDRVRISGEAALQKENGLYARNMLLPTGKEVMLSIGIAPRWASEKSGELLEEKYDEKTKQAAIDSANGIFRVWSTVLDDPASFPLFKGRYPLTPAAVAGKANWNPSDVVQLGCLEKGMPTLMITPYPIEFIDRDEQILIRFEEDNALRTIDMRASAATELAEPSPLGHSTGRWTDDGALLVRTTTLSWGILDDVGTPLSEDAELLETFRMTADGRRLNYTLRVDDPVNFSETLELNRYFLWRPELSVERYDCVVAQ